MDFDFFKNIVDFIKTIQVMEYAVKKNISLHKWCKKNIDKLLSFIYSKWIERTIIVLFSLLLMTQFIYGLLSFSLYLLRNNEVKIELLFEKIILLLFINCLLVWVFYKAYKDYEKDRISFLRTKHKIANLT